MKKLMLTIVFILLLVTHTFAQSHNWQNLDLKTDSIFGISTEKAYKELLKNRTAAVIVVAVIDNGIDTSQEDLRSIIWRNPKEIAGNGLDDDHNGYVDDLHGWNFLGTEIGVDDVTALARTNKVLYDSISYTIVPEAYRLGYKEQRKMWNEYSRHVDNGNRYLSESMSIKKILDSVLQTIGKVNPDFSEFKTYQPKTVKQESLINFIIHQLFSYKDFTSYKKDQIDNQIDAIQFHLGHGLNWEYDANEELFHHSGRFYGNADIVGSMVLPLSSPGADHGTHISGIIAAIRDNGIGIQGIANHVQIMPVRVMSFYRELRDYDLANGIRYAVDNGARVINLSFGKPYTYHKREIDEAVKYAMGKDVLIVHAAGNAGTDNDNEIVYPCAFYADGSGQANAWIEVGASDKKDDSTLLPSFSNYGKTTVDVFAPGVDIYSTLPNSKYASYGGTSMAAPVVAGLAALILEYHPKLSALQVKNIILKSVVKRIVLKDKCVSGGVVNAYNALQMADTYH